MATVFPMSQFCCPYCGGGLVPDAGAPSVMRDQRMWSGVLVCACCAYPVVDGIACVRLGDDVSDALACLREGRADDARLALLPVAPGARAAFTALLADEALTFRRALALLGPDAEGTYLLHRFSDPTFLASRALLGAVATAVAADDPRPVLDLCCGAGHLAWAVTRRAAPHGLVLADLAFWKVWLARRFMLPDAPAVCCDANDPLPFAPDTFALAYCADAFHYVWHRRRCADELSRVVGDRGVVVLAHVHNARAANHSTGMPLAPEGYAALFERAPARLFRDSALLDAALDGGAVDLSCVDAPATLADEPALHVVATHRASLFGRLAAPPLDAPGAADLNPLYVADDQGARLRFPTAEYEAEYGAARRYLPERVSLDGAAVARARTGAWDDALRALAARGVLLDLPARYL